VLGTAFLLLISVASIAEEQQIGMWELCASIMVLASESVN
jgi:hypothetical protein